MAFSRIAARIDGEDVPLMDLEPKSGLMDRVRYLMGINRSEYTHA